MHTSHSNHYNATLGMHTGSFAFARPSIGAWMSYGLGTVNQNLPSFLVFAPQMPYAGTQVWASDFLPGLIRERESSRAGTCRQSDSTGSHARIVRNWNFRHWRHSTSRIDRRGPTIRSWRLASKPSRRLMACRRKCRRLSICREETEDTLGLYGMTRETRDGFGWQCLARGDWWNVVFALWN